MVAGRVVGARHVGELGQQQRRARSLLRAPVHVVAPVAQRPFEELHAQDAKHHKEEHREQDDVAEHGQRVEHGVDEVAHAGQQGQRAQGPQHAQRAHRRDVGGEDGQQANQAHLRVKTKHQEVEGSMGIRRCSSESGARRECSLLVARVERYTPLSRSSGYLLSHLSSHLRRAEAHQATFAQRCRHGLHAPGALGHVLEKHF